MEEEKNLVQSEQPELPAIADLQSESLALINQIIAETDIEKTKDLATLFTVNQNKKTMVRQNKLNDLLDTLVEQSLTRFTTHPEEISTQDLFQGLKTVQDIIERSQKQVNGVQEAPLIQINQQSNDVNVNLDGTTKESRDKVKKAVLNLLNGLNVADNAANPIKMPEEPEEEKTDD